VHGAPTWKSPGHKRQDVDVSNALASYGSLMLPFCQATANRGTDPARAATARTACASSLGLRMLHPRHEPRGVDYKQPEVTNSSTSSIREVSTESAKGTRGAKGKEGKEDPSWRMGDVRPVTVPPRLKVVADEYQKVKASCANYQH
jgi:hypothetical protein